MTDNLQKLINEAAEEIIQNELPTIIKTKLKSTITDITSDLLGSYSSFGKQIKEQLQKELDINLANFKLADYNALVTESVVTYVNESLLQNSLEPIKKLVHSQLGFIDNTKPIKLSEIHTRIIEILRDDKMEDEGSFTFIVEHCSQHRWYNVYIDEDPDKSKHSCELDFCISEDNGTIFALRSSTRWGNKVHTNKIEPINIVELDSIAMYIFRLYSAGVEIKVDEQRFDNEWYTD
jgi:hypothetical protein